MTRRASAIMVARTAKLDRTKEMASYGCSACENVTVVQASLAHPHCVHCGSENTTPRESASVKGKTLQRAQDNELASVKCPGCSHHLIMTVATAAAHASGAVGHMNCPACSHEIAYTAPAQASVDDETWDSEQTATDGEGDDIHTLADKEVIDPALENREEASADDAPNDDTLVIDESTADGEESDGTEGDDDDSDEATDTASDDAAGDDEETTDDESASDNEDETTTEEETASDDADEDDADSDNDEAESNADDATEGDDDEESETAAPVITTTPTELKLYELCSTDDVEFVVAGDSIHCKQGSVITATRVCSEGENGEKLAEALTLACQTNPLDAILSTNGFEIATVTASVQVVDQLQADQREREVASAIDNDRAHIGEVLQQSLGIALCGMNRGFFNAENPFIKALASALEEEGLEEDRIDEIISDCLNETGDELAQVIRDLTMDTVKKPEEVRNELASTILTVKHKAVASVRAPTNRIASSLQHPLKPSSAATRKETAATTDDKPKTRIAELAARHGGSFSIR